MKPTDILKLRSTMTESFTGGIQQQIQVGRGISQHEDWSNYYSDYSVWGTKIRRKKKRSRLKGIWHTHRDQQRHNENPGGEDKRNGAEQTLKITWPKPLQM